jgi:hypothetical protein
VNPAKEAMPGVAAAIVRVTLSLWTLATSILVGEGGD